MSVRDEFYHAVVALSLASAPVLVVFSLFPGISTSRVVALVGLLFAIVLVGSARGIAHQLRDVLTLAHPRRIAVIGEASRLEFAEDALRSLPNARVFRLAVANIDGLGAVSPDAVASQPWFAHAVAWGCDTLVFTEILAPSLMPYVLAAAERHGMTIAFAPPRIRVHAYDLTIETVGKQALIVAHRLKATQPASRLGKRLFDLTLASLAAVLFAPVMALVALAISVEDGEPVLYRQERVGRDGRTFQILKFRSMRLDAEKDGAKLATSGDDRCTRVGRFIRRTSLDELPQLVQRPARRDVDRRPAPRAPGVRRPVREADPALRRAPPGAAGHHRLGPGLRQAGGGLRRRARQAARRPLLRRELVAVHGPRGVHEDRRRSPVPQGRLGSGPRGGDGDAPGRVRPRRHVGTVPRRAGG